MSVTFTLATNSWTRAPGDRWFRDISPPDEQWTAFEVGEFDPAGLEQRSAVVDLNGQLEWARESDRPVWEWTGGQWVVANEPEGSSVNVANHNARLILARLGLLDPASEELYGEARGRLLVEACSRALELEDPGEFGVLEGRVMRCGRPAGRLNDRIREIRSLAERAGDLGVIRWG